MTEKEKPDLPDREPNLPAYGYRRISEDAAVVRNLTQLGGVVLPRRKRPQRAGFEATPEGDE